MEASASSGSTAANSADFADTEKSREIRIGLVMYGGISLAIYINGVAREFYRAVRGESVYRLIKALTDSDIVVDIVSGTSAGGINGVLLGYALSNKADFATTAGLWRQVADIGALVRDPLAKSDKDISVLDGEGLFQTEIEKAFAQMLRDGERLRETDGTWKRSGIDPSHVQEMDVFITSTDVDGHSYTWFDSGGHAIDVKDHRAVFQLKLRAGRRNDFEPDQNGDKHRALGKLSRLTSCFPVAFPTVRVRANPSGQDPDPSYTQHWGTVDPLVIGWGRLPKPDAYFLDGGLLDNKPFTYTIKEIFHRLADRPVKRTLFYVEPDPETFAQDLGATQVNVLQAAQRALITIPGYESISDDLKLLTAHNDKIRRYRRLVGFDPARTVSGAPAAGPGRAAWLATAARAAESRLDEDTKACIARLRALERDERGVASGQPAGFSHYAKARLVELSERVVQGVLKDDGVKRQLNPDQQKAAVALYEMFDKWADVDAADRTLHEFDIYFRLRRMFHVLYACPAPGLERDDGGRLDPVNRLRRVVRYYIGRQIRLLEIVQAAMEDLVDKRSFPWHTETPQAIWQSVQAAYQRLLDNAGPAGPLPAGYDTDWSHERPRESWLDQPALNDVLGALRKRSDDQAATNPSAAFVNLLTLTDACERRMLARLDETAANAPHAAGLPPLLQTYERFFVVDADAFTLEMLAGLREKDIIETVRVSPRDARRAFSHPDLSAKVAGKALFHFGGFLKRSWRSNDLLWGRLDATSQIVEQLFERERIAAVVSDKALRARLRQDLQHGDLHPDRLFANAEPETRARLAQWLGRIVSDDAATRDAALLQTDAHLDALVEAAQLDYLGAEVKTVVGDAVYEQMEWNFYKRPPGGLPQPGAESLADMPYVQGNGRFDPTTHALAAAALSEQAWTPLRDPAKLKNFFEKDYRVGRETVARDIPKWVMLEIVLRALLIARNCVVYAMPEKWRDPVRKSGIYRALSAGLWLLYGLATTLRSSSRVALALRAGAIGMTGLSMVIAGALGSQAGCGDPALNIVWLGAIALPPWLLAYVAKRQRFAGLLLVIASFVTFFALGHFHVLCA
ncbi:MAG TPA: patatin-like protein [Burkholderiales bacterium]|nr:patatin-like protein [Burkholderiales bacterium]